MENKHLFACLNCAGVCSEALVQDRLEVQLSTSSQALNIPEKVFGTEIKPKAGFGIVSYLLL